MIKTLDIQNVKLNPDDLSGDVVLYGAGVYGQIALANLKKHYHNLNPVCFADDDLERYKENCVDGLPVMTLKQAMEKYENFSVIISCFFPAQVYKGIERVGFCYDKSHFFESLLIEDDQYLLFESNKKRMNKILTELCDYKSKAIYQCLVQCRITKDISILKYTMTENQYFQDDIFKVKQHGVMIDGGAYIGDTIEEYLKRDKSPKYIYSFEPDSETYKKLAEGYERKNVMIIQGGLSDKTGRVRFKDGQKGSSMVSDSGSTTIDVYQFDSLNIPDKNVTFIKLDTEGSELAALKGTENTIKTSKPDMAICIYHKFQDLWEIPEYIKSIVPEYKLYIRNHTPFLDEVVLYCTVN